MSPFNQIQILDVTRFNRHLLRSKLNWSDSHEDSEIPSRMFVFAVVVAARQLNLQKRNLPGVSAPQDYKTWPPKLGINAFGQSPHGSTLNTLQNSLVCATYLWRWPLADTLGDRDGVIRRTVSPINIPACVLVYV